MNIFFGFGSKTQENLTTLDEESTILHENSLFQLDLLNKMKMGIEIKKISTSSNTLLILSKKGKVYAVNEKEGMKQLVFEDEIIDICSGFQHHVVMSNTQVFTWFDLRNDLKEHGQLGRFFTSTSKFEPEPINRSFSYHQIYAGAYTTFIRYKGSLYMCGKCPFLQFGIPIDQEYVELLYEHVNCSGQLLTNPTNETFTFCNLYDYHVCCSVEYAKDKFERFLYQQSRHPTYWYTSVYGRMKVKEVVSSKNNILVHTDCDVVFYISLLKQQRTCFFFRSKTILKLPKKEKITKIIGSETCFFVLFADMSLYKIESQEYFCEKTYEPQFTHLSTFRGRKLISLIPTHGDGFVIAFRDNFAPELFDLFKNKKFVDLQIKKQKIHQMLFSFRLSLPPTIFTKLIEDKFTDKEFQHLILWVYTGLIRDWRIMERVCKYIKMKNVLKKDLRLDMETLAMTQSTMDYNLIVNKKSLKIHKFILQARSELFNTMFQLIDEKDNSVHDYSERSFRAVKIIVYFLYTNQFLVDEFKKEKNLTALFQDLEDAEDFYQMNAKSKFTKKLKKLKKNFQKQLLEEKEKEEEREKKKEKEKEKNKKRRK
ncbi:btk-binding protein-related [Anaeramoeba flamelloides]|uniref:Btk-binding protein-related n=1 Tax=Anaeramoeba flamelloides TaxID=1746091 RepID=A0ABQ8YLG3_9EUKA|nr:btk-binding protein-related [Anaeramoeba flamelloides]